MAAIETMADGETADPETVAEPKSKARKHENVMLAESYSEASKVEGWWLSEKFDGVRAVWNGKDFTSRLGNAFPAPTWFKNLMPKDCKLDGELWAGRGNFQQAISIVRNSARGDDWKYLTYMVFDIMMKEETDMAPEPFELRIECVQKIVNSKVEATGKTHDESHIKVVPQHVCAGKEEVQEHLKAVEAMNGEGLMLRKPKSPYAYSRSKNLLKVKSHTEEEAKVTGHEKGKGRNKDVIGALLVETPDGRKFKIGSGLNDTDRENPPEIGSMVTYKYLELTDGNIPRFPTYRGVRIDLNWSDYCASYKPPGKKLDGELTTTLHSCLFDGTPMEVDKKRAADATSTSPSAKRIRSSPSKQAASDPVSEKAAPLSNQADVNISTKPTGSPKQVENTANVGSPKQVENTGSDKQAEKKLPVCKYGRACPSKSAAHVEKWAHPWRIRA